MDSKQLRILIALQVNGPMDEFAIYRKVFPEMLYGNTELIEILPHLYELEVLGKVELNDKLWSATKKE